MAFAVVHSQDSPAKTPNYAKNGKNNMKEFIALHNRTVSRDEIQTVIALAKEQNNTEVIYRLSKILNDHPDSNRFNINIINYPQETDNQAGLAGTRHSGDYREALDECGRLKKGWHFVDGKVVKVTPRTTTISKNTQKNNDTNKKYKFIVFIGGFDRIAGIYSYQDIAVKGFYYEKTFDNGIRLYKTIRIFAKSEETKTLIEEQYTEGKDFVYLKFDGKNKEEYYSMLESHSSPTDKSAPSDLSSKIYTAETFAKDLDFNTLKRSYSWISFDPDTRAERDIKQWGEMFYSLYNSLSEEAKKQGVLEKYNSAFNNGYNSLLKLEREIIATRSKTFSTAITGGAGITEKQISTNEKRMRLQSEKSELWSQKYDKLHKILEKIAKNKPEDLYEEGDIIKSTDNNAMTKLQQKLKMLQDRKTMLKNGVVAAKEYQKNKDLSVFKKYNIDEETTKTIVNHIDKGGKPTEKDMYNWFTMPYLNRDIKEVEKRIAILEKNQAKGTDEILIEGGKIVHNGEAQRLQIFFDGIPSKEVREALKSHAFKWAPTAKAWQRTLTENAKYAVNQYLIKTGILKLRTALSAPHQEDEIAFLSAAGIDYFPEAPDDETQGLGKPVPAADIYKMVTDKIIGMLKSASPTDYHRAWKDDVFFIPINYASKKPYRGINRLLLQERIGFAGAFRNPYFLTFKQIKKHKGTLKKGAKGYEVIYYSIRYVVPADKNSGRKAYSSTNAQKVLDFLHKYKLSEDIVGRIPMIRYYNVYNGADIENIDFKLDELQIGRAVPDSATENRAAQLIVENYPNPPAIKHEGNQAYYNPASDYIKLPKQEQFDTVNDYYRTLFHELTHSTGHNKRLNRGIHLMLEKDDYAKEELVAEFGAVFLSAWAGIMWYNNKNHAAYLKGWNSAIKEAQNDNKFLMRAASLAQQATDYILALDKDGNPAFLKKLQPKKAPKNTPKTPSDKSAPSDSSTTTTNTPTIATTLIASSTQPTRIRLSVANSKQEDNYDKIADKNGFINAEKLKQLLEVWKKDKDFYFEEGFINPADFAKTAPASKEKGIFTLKNIVSKDNLRPILTGVLIEKDKYVATDAMNLLIVKRPKNDGLKTGTIYDPTPEPQYSKSYRGTAPFADDQTIQNSRYIDGNFPKYQDVVNIPNYKVKMFELAPIINTLYASLEIGKRIHTEDYRMVININGKESGYFMSVKLLFNALQALKANGSEKAMFLISKNGFIYIISDNGNIALTVSAKGYDGSVREHFIQLPTIELTVPKEFVPDTKATLNAPHGLFGKYPEINTLAFKKMKVTELREFTLEFYRLFLKGKKKEIEKHLKEVVFTSEGGRKIAYGEAMYSAKAAVIEHLDTLIKNSTYNNWGDRKTSDNEEILGYLNFKSKITIDGKKRHVRIAISVDKDRNMKFKSYDIGKKKSISTHKGVKPFSGGVETLSTESVAKTVPNSALSAPRHAGILKEALTEKGKLKKGWYFQDYGIIDPKGKYHPLERDYSLEYNLIEKELRDRAFLQDEKRKIKGFEENKKLEEAIKIFLKELSKKNKKHFKNNKAMEVFYWAFPFTLERNSTFYTFEESNPYINKNLQELDKYFSDDNELFERLKNYETLRRYRLKSLGLHISTKISSFIDKQGKVIRGDSNKLNQKYGLSAPEVFVEHSSDPYTQPAPSITPRNNSLANKMATLQNRTFETFIIADPQMQAFLGDVERKNTGSTAITITGGAGSGKTRFAFQFINALAQNYKVGHASLEEQPDSKLYFDKVQQYLDQTAQANVEAPEIENMQDLQALIERNDVIVIDSFTKIREWDRNFLLDRDLRKKYNGKLFLIIFQQTVAGNMRGGTTSEFDGDIILYTQVFPDYRENYTYPYKNRYNSTPREQLRYSVYHQQLLPSESTPPDSSPVTSNTYEVIY